MGDVEIVSTSDVEEFKKRCADLIRQGYEISSTYCGFLQSEEYDFCDSYQAILVFKYREEL